MEAIKFMDDFFLRSGSKYPTLMELPFAKLGIQWGRSKGEKMFVHGKLNGNQELSLEIDLWEVELPLEGKPQFLVHEVAGSWLKLSKPRDFYLETMKGVLVASYFLIFAKQNPNSSQGAVWRYVRKECRDFKAKPNHKDLIQATLLIQSIVRTDPILQASRIIPQFFPDLSKNVRLQVVQGCDHSRKLLPVKREISPVAEALTSEEPSNSKKAAPPSAEVTPPASGNSTGIRNLTSEVPSSSKKVAPPSVEVTPPAGGNSTGIPIFIFEEPSSLKEADPPSVEVTPPSGDNLKGITNLQSTIRIHDLADFPTEGNAPLLVEQRKSKKRKAVRPADSVPRRKENRNDQGSEVGDNDWVDEPDVCAFCDDGVEEGEKLLCCDGPCMRSFHPTRASGRQNECVTLGLLKRVISAKNWICPNCEAAQHQCFVCGKLGNSATSSALQEVFLCGAKQCRRFYHPDCVAKLLVPGTARSNVASNIQKKLDTFICPLHKCASCQMDEDKTDPCLCLIKCRRCPTAWHEKCLPEECRSQLWPLEGGKYVMYCGRHRLDPKLLTPKRDHIIFPISQKAINSTGRKLVNRKRSSASPGTRKNRELSPYQKVREIVSESCKKVTLETVRQKLRLPPPTPTLEQS